MFTSRQDLTLWPSNFGDTIVVVLKSGLKNNWMKKLDRVNRPLEEVSDVTSTEKIGLSL